MCTSSYHELLTFCDCQSLLKYLPIVYPLLFMITKSIRAQKNKKEMECYAEKRNLFMCVLWNIFISPSFENKTQVEKKVKTHGLLTIDSYWSVVEFCVRKIVKKIKRLQFVFCISGKTQTYFNFYLHFSKGK